MAKKHNTNSNKSSLFYYLMFILCSFSTLSFIYLSTQCHPPSKFLSPIINDHNQSFNILSFKSSLNQLSFPNDPPSKLLKIALFVKKWPLENLAGGLERHALVLHLALAKRGHNIHVFTVPNPDLKLPSYPTPNMEFHFTTPTAGGVLDRNLAWEQFQTLNNSDKPFDLIHSESVALFHRHARGIAHLAVSWHGIAYETIHSDIVKELLRKPEEPIVKERVSAVVEEVKFFPDYRHHIAISDHTGDVLKRIYMIPEEQVHIIVNGVDESMYKPNVARGAEFRKKVGVTGKKLVIGMAGRLVRDKGHPLMFEALKEMLDDNRKFGEDVAILIAGNGPWGKRYKKLNKNILVLGPLNQSELAGFYNSIDVFLNPTLRAQGLDRTFIEAMISGVAIMGTRFASVTGSLITGDEIGYTFSPNVNSLKGALNSVLEDGKEVLRMKGEFGRRIAEERFTATKMAAAYERLFLCISREDGDKTDYCTYTQT